MKIDYDKEFKKLKRLENVSTLVGGIGLGALITLHKWIGAKENGLRTAKQIDVIMENLENHKKE
jgi:hypothetical protein